VFACSHEPDSSTSLFFDQFNDDGYQKSFEDTNWAQCLSANAIDPDLATFLVMDATHRVSIYSIDFAAVTVTATPALSTLQAFESFNVASVAAYALYSTTELEFVILGLTSKIHGVEPGYNMGFVSNLDQNRLNPFWDTATVTVPNEIYPTEATLASPTWLSEGLEFSELYDDDLGTEDFGKDAYLHKNNWTEDVCPPIEQTVETSCYYYEVFDTSYAKYMSNLTALDPPHSNCTDTGAISWRQAMTEAERTACYPLVVTKNLLQSEQQYDK